jgi:transposase
MAHYKKYSRKQKKFIPVSLEEQIIPGTFEYALDHLIDNAVDTSVFDQRFENDATGAPAYNPRMLLKIVLYAYSRGVISSRKIARLCETNVVFMALSGDSRPHFTTIADFVSRCEDTIISVFRDILFVCEQEGLIGKDMFAIDGVKLPSNASKQWSGKKRDFIKKLSKLERAIREIVAKHRQMDLSTSDNEVLEKEKKRLKHLRQKYNKIKDWIENNDDKRSLAGKVVQSNITDNDSAKMSTSHGVIQGYDGVAAVDGKHQVIVAADAFGEAQENHLLKPMIQNARENIEAIAKKEKQDAGKTKIVADAGFHSEANMKHLFEDDIDGYVADTQFRKRDQRFKDQKRYKEKARKQRQKKADSKKLFSVEDFVYDEKNRICICPAGRRLYNQGGTTIIRGFEAIRFRARKSVCSVCDLRRRCLKYPERTESRQVAFFIGRAKDAAETYTEKMKRKIDSAYGRFSYGQRLGTVEPVFANICSTKGLNRFSLRGKLKVRGQWLLYCIVHNIEKIANFAPSFA